MLRNFPHQVNQLEKIHAALLCCYELIASGRDISDDEILGYACARRKIYTFRNLTNPSTQEIENRIQEERKKKSSDQGPRTFARDLRRTLLLMDLLDNSSGHLELSEIGTRLINFAVNSTEAEYIQIWRDAILRITLPPALSYKSLLCPAPIMLRIVAENPGVDKHWLALALAAKDNSKTEYKKIERLIRSGDFEKTKQKLNATDFQINNSIKILPSLLEQIVLIKIKDGVCYPTDDAREMMSGKERVIFSRDEQSPRKERKRVRSQRPLESNIQGPEDIRIPTKKPRQIRPQEAIETTLALLGERTQEHQTILKALIASLKNVSDLAATPDKYDLFANSTAKEEALLFEIKTGGNYSLQARLALGQLYQYEFFDILPFLPDSEKILKIAVFDGEPGQDSRDFLNNYEVYVVSHLAKSFVVPPELADYFKEPQ